MPIKLTHIGEDLVAAMLEDLFRRNLLSQVVCEISGRTLAQDIEEGGLGDDVQFHADAANLSLQTEGTTFSCDGEQKIDVLCAGQGNAIAFEAKLGTERMGAAEFYRRVCMPCERSKHADLRISGSMIALLERSLPFNSDSNLVARLGIESWRVAQEWWLVLRESVVTKWRKSGSVPVKSARIISFDSLAQVYGSGQQFDLLVQRVVGREFALQWSLSFNDS
jgi:hypothetical protein